MRTLLHRLLLPLFSVALALLVLEIGLRLFMPSRAPDTGYHTSRWASPDPVLGWRLRPGSWPVDILQKPMTILEDGTRRTTDSKGSGQRMLLVGGSYALGYGVEDKDTLASQLQQRLPGVEIVNAAVPGYGTWQSFLLARDFLARNQDATPETILYAFGAHHMIRNTDDLAWIQSLRTYSGGQIVHPHLQRSGANWQEQPPDHIDFLGLADDLRLALLVQKVLLQWRFQGRTGQEHREATKVALERFAAWSRDQGVRLVVASIFCEDCSWLCAWCEEHRVDYVDASPDVAWQERGWFLADEKTVGSHPNARFYTHVADKLAEALCKTSANGCR